MDNRYSRFGNLLAKQDTRRDINAALLSLQDEFDSVLHIGLSTTSIYLSESGGNDLNDGTSQTQAIKTSTRLVELLRGCWFGPVVVFVYSGTYDLDELTDNLQYIAMTKDASLHFLGIDKQTISTGTVQVGSTTTVVQLSSIGATDRSGYSLEFTSGALTGVRRTINRTTSSTATFNFPLTSIPVSGDNFEIFEPEAIFKRSTVLSPVSTNLSLPIGINTNAVSGNLEALQQRSTCSFSNILFQNVSATATGTWLHFSEDTTFFGVMFRDFSFFSASGGFSSGTSLTQSSKVANVSGPSSLSALSNALGLGTSGYIPLWDGYSFGTDPALVSSARFVSGLIKVVGGISDSIFFKGPNYATCSGVRSRVQFFTGFNSDVTIDNSDLAPTTGIALFTSPFSHVDLGANVSLSGAQGILCRGGSRIRVTGSGVTITGTAESIRCDSGVVEILSTTVLTGSTRIGSNASATVLNMKTAAAVSAIQAPASYAVNGDCFSSGYASIARIS